jgi:hypothetical protein
VIRSSVKPITTEAETINVPTRHCLRFPPRFPAVAINFPLFFNKSGRPAIAPGGRNGSCYT